MSSPRRNWGRIFRLGLGTAAFAALLAFSRPAEIGRILVEENLAWLGGSCLLLLLVMVIRAWRWRWLLADFGLPVPYRVLLELVLIGNYFNLFLPGSLGGDAYRAIGLARYSTQTLRPVATVIIERFTGLIALFTIGPVAAWLARDRLPVSPHLLVPGGVGLLACTVVGLLVLLHVEPLFARLRPILPAMLVRRLSPEKLGVLFGVVRDLRRRPRAFVRASAISILLQLTVLTTYYAMSLALHGDISPAIFYGVFPVIEFASLIPVTINGLGVREGLMVWFLEQAAVPASFTMGLAIMNRMLGLAMGALGGAILIARRRSPARPDASGTPAENGTGAAN